MRNRATSRQVCDASCINLIMHDELIIPDTVFDYFGPCQDSEPLARVHSTNPRQLSGIKPAYYHVKLRPKVSTSISSMRRFTEILLLVAYTHLLSFANSLQEVRSAVTHNALPKSGVIRGLLDTRQILTCPGGEGLCAARTFCCPVGWLCCSNTGICCEPGHYCVVATNGVIACCPNGEVCFGPAGPPGQDPPPTQTTFRTSTSTTRIATAFTSTSTSTSTSTRTFTTLLGAPTQKVTDTTIEVSVLDVNITWSENWVQRTSSCSPSVTSKSTSTVGSSFTYLFQIQSSAIREGYFYHYNVVNNNTMWEIFMNGVLQQTAHQFSSSDCTYSSSYFIPKSASQNLTVVVRGSDSTAINPWSFEVNKLLIVEPDTSSTSSGGPGSPTGLALSASGRAQPYRPLLIFAGILLALLYCA